MASFPQIYRTHLTSSAEREELTIRATPAPDLMVGAPAHFGGTDDHWSPETLLTGAVASCFALSFSAIAGAKKFAWRDLGVEVAGALDRVDRQMQFTKFVITAKLLVDEEGAIEAGRELLEKAGQSCLVSASLKSEITLNSEVIAGA